MSAYHQHLHAHTALVDALEALDAAEQAYCKDTCEKESCDEDGHIPPPDDNFFEEIASLRVVVKAQLVGTLSAVLAVDPLPVPE